MPAYTRIMHSYLAMCNILYWVALTIWISVLIAAGVTATSTFTTLPDETLGVTLERFAAFDADQHGRIAAGLVMEPVFTFVDLMQIATAAIVGVILLLQLTVFKLPWRSISNVLRTICIAVAIGLLVVRTLSMTPEMNSNLRAFWEAAEAGDAASALSYREAFESQHGTASAMFRGTLICLMIALCASAIALGPGVANQHSPPRLERPRLAT